MKFGYIPSARPTEFKLASYLPDLPTPPDIFGNYNIVLNWNVLGNDKYGCCVFSGAAHEHMMWTLEGDAVDSTFSTDNVLDAYSAVTGFDVNNLYTDRGTDMEAAANWRRHVGIQDTAGIQHRIEAYVSTRARDVATAAWLFGAVGVGVMVPPSWMDSFYKGEPWDVANDRPDGGHYVPIVGRVANGNLVCVTWGKTQEITQAALDKYLMEAIVYLTPERLIAGATPEGFNIEKLREDLSKLKK